MGCGESKQAIATENTLIKSKSKSKKSENSDNLPVEKPTNDGANVKIGEIVEENEKIPLIGKENDNSTKEEDEKEKEKEVVDHGHKESVAGKKPDEAVVVVQEKIKGDVKNDEELKGGENENVVVVPNVTPKKDDHDDEKDTIESIISDGISGKSDYFSPRSKGHVSEGNDDEEKGAEAKSDKGKEDVMKVEEAKVLSDEPKSSGEEKILVAENETAKAASTTEVKAN